MAKGKQGRGEKTRPFIESNTIEIETIKAHDGIPQGYRQRVKKDFPYLGYMVKEGYWKKIDE